MGSRKETATESTHDETLAKIHHQLVLYVKEKERIDELRQARIQLSEVWATLNQQISDVEDEISCSNKYVGMKMDPT